MSHLLQNPQRKKNGCSKLREVTGSMIKTFVRIGAANPRSNCPRLFRKRRPQPRRMSYCSVRHRCVMWLSRGKPGPLTAGTHRSHPPLSSAFTSICFHFAPYSSLLFFFLTYLMAALSDVVMLFILILSRDVIAVGIRLNCILNFKNA